MQIRSTKNHHSQQGKLSPQVPAEQSEEEANSILDRFRPQYEKLNIHLDSPEYKGIEELEAANMLGHFTQTMQNGGYPWKLREAVPKGDGNFKAGEKVSDMEALSRLKKGEPLLLQPLRDLQLDLSSDSITAIAAAGSVGSTDLGGLSKVASYSKNSKVSAGNQGFSVKFGEPVVIENFAQLKLLHQMYDPADKIEGKSETAKAAHQFSYFTQKTVSSAFPWRFYVKDDSNPFLRVAKHTALGTAKGAAVGGVIAGAFGGLMALGFQDWSYLAGAATIGAGIGGVSGGYEAARTSLKGTPVSSVEALEHVLNDQNVVFQESRARSIKVPMLGQISWFSDQGKGSVISDVDQLNTFYYMQSQEDLPKPKKPEKKEEKKPEKPSVTIIDQSINNHYHNTSNTNHPTKVVVVDENPIHQFYR